MTGAVLDSGAVSMLAGPDGRAAELERLLIRGGVWPPAVPSMVLVECLTGHPGKDALTNRLLKVVDIVEVVPEPLARRAAALRTQARRGSAVDALLVALAEPGGVVLTADRADLDALAEHAADVLVQPV